jgi:hypothetical protein
MVLALALVAGALLFQELAPGVATPGTGLVTPPPGRVAEMLERIGDAAPASGALAVGAPWPAWEDRSSAGWGGEPVWRRWVELARAESEAAQSAPARRAQLALVARLQGRDGDAWEHLLACEPEPALVAALLPLFSPGVPRECLGRSEGLPDGVLLTPALPPANERRAGLRWLAGKRIEHREFGVGAARCALTVSVEPDGIEVDLRHLSGGAARVRVQAPVPRGVEAGLAFADWEKLPPGSAQAEFRLDSESSEHSLWLTFHPPEARWPSPALDALGALNPGREILLESPRGDEPELLHFAAALSELLGVAARLGARGAPARAGLEPLVLRFDPGPARERMLVDLVGLAEAFALSAPDR